jgi:hypothetical protein
LRQQEEDKSMYRILTEEKNVEQVKATLTGLGLDFTLFNAPQILLRSRNNKRALCVRRSGK